MIIGASEDVPEGMAILFRGEDPFKMVDIGALYGFDWEAEGVTLIVLSQTDREDLRRFLTEKGFPFKIHRMDN